MLFIDKIPHSIDVIGFWGICIIGLTSAWMKAIGWKNIRTNLCSIHAWPKSKDISVWQILTNPRSIRLTLSLIWVEKFFNSILYQHLHNSKNVACHEIKVLMSFNYYSLIPFHKTLSINHLCLETFLIVRWQWTKKLTQKLTKNILIESSFSDLHIESHDVRSSTIILMEKTLILDKKQMDRRMKGIFSRKKSLRLRREKSRVVREFTSRRDIVWRMPLSCCQPGRQIAKSRRWYFVVEYFGLERG